MDGFLSNFIGAAIVAAASGAAFLAYKHPEGYRRLSDFLNHITSLLGIAVASWMLALEFTKMGVERVLVQPHLAAAKAVIASLSLPAWAVIAFCAMYAYVMGLRLLPRIKTEETAETEPPESSN